MAAKAIVPVEALPCIDRFRGHGPLLQKPLLRLAMNLLDWAGVVPVPR